MPRTLADLSEDERKALLNHVWHQMVATEIASPLGTDVPIVSPLGQTGALPHDLAPHLAGGLNPNAVMDWKILNAACSVPNPVAKVTDD